MTTFLKLKSILPTQEGLTLRVGTVVAVTDEWGIAWNKVRTRVILVADARYHVRNEDLVYACGEP